jgi:hypothetical protein
MVTAPFVHAGRRGRWNTSWGRVSSAKRGPNERRTAQNAARQHRDRDRITIELEAGSSPAVPAAAISVDSSGNCGNLPRLDRLWRILRLRTMASTACARWTAMRRDSSAWPKGHYLQQSWDETFSRHSKEPKAGVRSGIPKLLCNYVLAE